MLVQNLLAQKESLNMTNIKYCEHCGAEPSFECNKESDPREGEACGICGDWVCVNCVDWGDSGYAEDIICKNCSRENKNGHNV